MQDSPRSGNILMEANDHCASFPSRRPGPQPGRLFLPFEGDRRRTVILGKAMPLAKDKAITDPTITQQLRHTA
ncbi:hypothetical protein [Allorhizocola rhizosphaerae]|uniref:DUF7737 domain-containing protein n=1 Tax=Allorhizocola rhizosphaerae TaxID=1872709 RepID=UPI0013C2C2A7|nr:hypothetical protein [Allorhizocola rhizosphaerae]